MEQLTDNEQLNGLAALLLEAAEHKMDGKKTLVQVVDLLEKQMDEKRPCFSSRSWKTQRPGTAETAGNLCMPEPVQGTAVLRKFVTIQSHKKSSGKPLFFSESIGLAEDLFYLLFSIIYSPQIRTIASAKITTHSFRHSISTNSSAPCIRLSTSRSAHPNATPFFR